LKYWKSVEDFAMERIEQDSSVTIKFIMKTKMPDGEFEERPEEEASFIFGINPQAESLEKALEGAQAGDRLSLSIPSSEVYGEHDPSLIREIPKKGLIKQRVKEGKLYRQMKMGSLVSFKILEIRQDTVLVDFNRPMAGISVTIEVEVVSVRKSTTEEIKAAYEMQAKKDIGCG
jgi:FKBP-type peptidyl-prolyl cis-trans isomerase SlyD